MNNYLFISLYLNLQPDQHGKDNFHPFVRKELPQRVKSYAAGSEARGSLDRDVDRIERYLANELPAAANGLALFACAGRDLFEAVAIDAPIPNHLLSIAPEPHVYPLALLVDQHPPHAVVLADGHLARIFVFAFGQTIGNASIVAPIATLYVVSGFSRTLASPRVSGLSRTLASPRVSGFSRTSGTPDLKVGPTVDPPSKPPSRSARNSSPGSTVMYEKA